MAGRSEEPTTKKRRPFDDLNEIEKGTSSWSARATRKVLADDTEDKRLAAANGGDCDH